jgi:integrase
MMSWLGVRRLDWLGWSATVFDRDLLAFRQKKTDIPLVLPWSVVPPLADRVAAAKRRRSTMAEPPLTFFHDMHGRPWAKAASFRQQFNRLRGELERRQPTFATRYYVGLVAGDPLSIPTAELTMRTMRHTCVTLNHDAGISRELIGSITDHSPESIDEIMAHYTARTADQAEAALTLKLKFEANPGRKPNTAFPSHKAGQRRPPKASTSPAFEPSSSRTFARFVLKVDWRVPRKNADLPAF